MNYGTGALESKYDIRDYRFSPADRGGFDWEVGYDIEKELGVTLVVKDQDGSSSCGGQAWAYYGEVLEKFATGDYEQRSARWIYSHTHKPTGGSVGRENCAFCIKNGWALEKHASSYDQGKPPREKFMIQIPDLSPIAKEDLEVSKALSYLRVSPNIEVFAQAIQENHGLVLVLNGADNGSWRTLFPKPPTEKEWGHFLYAGRAKMIDGKKYIGVVNSWGDVGEKGWQWIGEDYFNSGHVREGWTMAWNYTPAKNKIIMKQMIKLLTRVVELLTKQKQND